MAKQTKGELDALIAEAGISADAARKLHRANGTDDTKPADAGTEAPVARRGHGSAEPVRPDLGDF